MIFLIPARAGSKRLPGKNKMLFRGKPLYQWSVETAERVKSDGDSIVVSTDDPDILSHPLAIRRRDDLAQDSSPTQALVDCYLAVDDVCLLQPTSPTRKDSLVRKLINTGVSCRSVTNGTPNGQCYVYRRPFTEHTDIETERGVDIDTKLDFITAEQS